MVTWYNDDEVFHTVTSPDGLFDSGPLRSGAGFGFTFNQAGAYEYVCGFHGTMKGRVVVEE